MSCYIYFTIQLHSYSYWFKISKPWAFNNSSFLNFSISDLTISLQSSLTEYLGFHHKIFLALLASHNKKSTSAGLKYFGSTSTKHFHVSTSYTFSSTQVHFHSNFIPTSSKLRLTKSLTVLETHVAITKSSGLSCCNINRIAST